MYASKLLRLSICAGLLAGACHAQQKNRTYGKGELAVAPGIAIIVNRFGVFPDKIVRPEGPFVLYIENNLPGHTDHYSLRLDQSGASEFLGLDTTASKNKNAKLLDLHPGKYRLSFGKTPAYTVTIEVQPKD